MRNVLLAIFVGALALGDPAVSDAQLVLYDDFSSPLINPDKWFGTNTEGGSANPTTEAARLIKSGQLKLRLNQYGRGDSDSGTSGGRIRLQFTNPVPITTMQAVVTVLSAAAEACPTNTSAARSAAFIIGEFFNDGSSTGTGDNTGDMQASLRKVSDSTLGNFMDAVLTRCSNASCSSLETVASQTFTASWAPNDSHTLTLAWDAPNHQFIFSVKPKRGSTEIITLPYVQSEPHPPAVNVKEFIIVNTAANCNGSQTRAFMDVLFDTVMVNQ